VQWLTDIVDGRLIIDGRSISLAAPVRTRLTARLDHRARARPNTPKPHLLVNRRTAPRPVPVGHKFPWLHTTLRTQALARRTHPQREPAIGGDIRRICDLFGLSVEGTTRYLRTVEHSDLTMPGECVPRS
jgi:hypothetical protein